MLLTQREMCFAHERKVNFISWRQRRYFMTAEPLFHGVEDRISFAFCKSIMYTICIVR